MYYIGCKQVQAYSKEQDGRPGYEVRYPDGYVSWSPKETFESANVPMGEDSDGSSVTQEMVTAFIRDFQMSRMGNSTIIQAVLANGYTIIEDFTCVDESNYDEKLGVRYAMEKVERKVWNLLGFLLASARNGVS